MSPDSAKIYDVFLSYNRQDRDAVTAIANRLRTEGRLNPFFDDWHLIPGEPWQEALEDALDRSKTVAVFFGPRGLGTWENEELRSALEDRAKDKSFRVIPVLLPGATVADRIMLPRFLRRLTWVDFRGGLEDSGPLRDLIAGIAGCAPGIPVQPGAGRLGILHPLPPAPVFIGRRNDIASIAAFVAHPTQNVLSLIGLGGAGKTALVAEFLSRAAKGLASIEDLYVWSFYVDQDVNEFLRCALTFFSCNRDQQMSKGSGTLMLLADALANNRRKLIVMDGLERVQRTLTDCRGIFGEIEDPLLRQVLRRLAVGFTNTKVIITSRFPITDLEPWSNKEYVSRDVDRLTPEDAIELLQRRGVRGSIAQIATLVQEFGSHALTLDHLGSYLVEFYGGDASRGPQLERPDIASSLPQEVRLARIMLAYEKALDPLDLALLERLSVFRFGTGIDALARMFSQPGQSDITGPLREVSRERLHAVVWKLERLHLIIAEQRGSYTAHPAIRDYFYRRFANREAMHVAAAAAFRQQLSLEALEQWETTLQVTSAMRGLCIGESRPRGKRHPRFGASESLWDAPIDVATLDRLWSRLIQSLADDGWWTKSVIEMFGTTRPSLKRITRVRERLKGDWLWDWTAPRLEAYMKFAARTTDPSSTVGRIIATVPGEWLAKYGETLSNETRSTVLAWIQSLPSRQSRLAPQLSLEHSRLASRPGVKFPDDPRTLDLLEELIHHTIRAGEVSKAYEIYHQRLGGRDWLGKHLGENARGLRIVENFQDAGARIDCAWYLRGVGQIDRAYSILSHENAIWSGSVLCLRGHLCDAENGQHFGQTKSVARFLRTGDRCISSTGWGEAIITAEYHLIAGDLERALFTAAEFDRDQHTPEFVRGQLVRVEVAQRQGRIADAEQLLEEAKVWILQSGSVEHLCLLHLARARLYGARQRFDEATAATAEGILLARTCGLGLYHIDLLIADANLCLSWATRGGSSPLDTAERQVLRALNGVRKSDNDIPTEPDQPLEWLACLGAAHPKCGYGWGKAAAYGLLSEICSRTNRPSLAREYLEHASECWRALNVSDTRRTITR